MVTNQFLIFESINFNFRSASAASKVAEMFSNRMISKHYWAVTVGIPTSEEGEINIPIGEAKLLGGYRIVTRPDLIGKSSEVWECAVPEKNPYTPHRWIGISWE